MTDSSPEKNTRQEERLVKLLLPIQVIRAMDRLLVDGVGGFSTRNEFVREAIESYCLELTHELAPAEPEAAKRTLARLSPVLDGPPESIPPNTDLTPRPRTLVETALPPLPTDGEVTAGVARVIDDVLFGMHNRDYPSLWAARQLVDYLEEGPLTFDEFAERATDEAWSFADALRSFEAETGQKLTALFPTNPKKRQTASSAFRVFGIGSITAGGEEIHADGPLFQWRVIDVVRRDRFTYVGVTAEGRALLDRLSGLTVVPPHPPEKARIFLAHLREYARSDWWGFEHALRVVADRPTRVELVEAFRVAQTGWSESVAATNAQGYLARAREWGLITPKVMDGRYELTELGAELLAEGAAE